MALTVRTVYPNLLYQIRITNNTDANLELIRYTYSTGLLSSAYLPASAIAILQARWNILVSGLSASQINGFVGLLANLLLITDSDGAITPHFSNDVSGNYLYVDALNGGASFVFNLGIPHSAGLWIFGPAATSPLI